MRTIVTFKTTQQGDVDFSAEVSQDRAAADAQATLDRYDGDVALAATNFLSDNPAYTADWTTFPRTGNYVEVRREGVKKF